ncbi:hypothetical protein QBC43DRAFT_291310 [Cladorrhinum sp. PSN259]|nr:hypothetical protein QBC43DRAFT_291310 [Cladorrhinum sp. PSN259]
MSLFIASRTALRASAPLKKSFQLRSYATEPTPSSSSNLNKYLAGLGAAAVGAGAYFYAGSSPAAKKAEEKVKHAIADKVAPSKAFSGEWLSLKIEEVEQVNHNSKRLRLKLPEDNQVSGLEVASAVLTKFKPSEGEKAVLRPYTPISEEDAQGYIDLLIKKYPNGPMSTHLHSLAPGQTVDVKGPLPKYPWSPNKHEHIALVAGGTGITPMYQLLRAIFKNPEDKTKVTLVFGNITEEDILLKKELAQLENTYPQRFRAFYVLDKPPKSWVGGSGYINKELLKTVLPEPKNENIKVFVCGPPGMMDSISGNKKSPKDQGELKGVLKELGYNSEQVYKF